MMAHRKLFAVLLVISFIAGLLSGCSAPDASKAVGDSTPETIKDEIGDSQVVRSFSASQVSSGDKITVTLKKTLDEGQKTILVEENFPPGWTVVDAGTGVASGNTIKWAELATAKPGIFTYTVQATSDSGIWTGQYSINGLSLKDIGGLSKLE